MSDLEVTADHVRAARRAYYGAISYVDDHVSALIGMLRETGRLDNAVVILSSDHGEMLGERGAWYKMSFYEGAARVPLVVRAPSLFPPGRVAAPVSTMDLLPTLIAVANDGDHSAVIGPLDGRNLMPHLTGDPDRDEVVGEYLAEGAIAPIVMIRRGRHKFIHSPADPDQLFDLGSDPDEQFNLAGDPDSAGLVDGFKQEIAARWNLKTLDCEVRQSQQRRLFVSRALGTGVQAPWDFAPTYDASRRYIRNHMDLADLENMARFPPVERQSTAAAGED
jgi:choline-sulfatase